MNLMEFETEWEQRNYERQKKLELNRYTFISRQDEKALRRKRNVLLYAIVGTLVAGVIIFAKKKGATFQKERCTNFRHKQRQKAANNSKKVAAFFIFKGRLKTFQKAFRLSIAKL